MALFPFGRDTKHGPPFVKGGTDFASAIHEGAIWTAALISPPP
jgi:hypothetical protein